MQFGEKVWLRGFANKSHYLRFDWDALRDFDPNMDNFKKTYNSGLELNALRDLRIQPWILGRIAYSGRGFNAV